MDMPENSNLRDINRFCIGPSTEYLWWYQKRDELSANRGPCEYPAPHDPRLANQSNIRGE